jgi:predicted transcriptional regulator
MKTADRKHAQIKFAIGPDLYAAIEAIAKHQNRTVTGVIRHTILQFVEREADQPLRGPLDRWIASSCETGVGKQQKAAELYTAYCIWAANNGEIPLSVKKWSRAMLDSKFYRFKNSTNYYGGISLVV